MSHLSPITFALLICLVLVPPLTFHQIMLPCWDCADFEAAMLHEIGHFAGINHPDNIPYNLASTAATYVPSPQPNNSYNALLAGGGLVNASTCKHLWEHVSAGIPEGWTGDVETGIRGYKVRNSVMEAFTQHNPKPCLTADDVEALSTLYPDCSGVTSVSAPVCHKVLHNIGAVRINFYVLFPLLVTFVFSLSLFSWVQYYREEELHEKQKELLQAKEQLLKKKTSRNLFAPTSRKNYFASPSRKTKYDQQITLPRENTEMTGRV